MRVVIPMAGKSSRFFEYGFETVKYKLPVDTQLTPMIDKAISTLDIEGDYIFVTRGDDEYLEKYGKVVKIDKVTDGPACTVNLVSDLICDEDELIIANCDQIMHYDSTAFLEECRKYDGCVMTYSTGKRLKPGSYDKNSYIAFEPTKLSEKVVISDNALTGIHYFKKGKYFKDAYNHMVANNVRAPNGEFYVSLVYQSMVDLGMNVGMHKIQSGFCPVGEPMDYFDYLYSHGGYKCEVFDVYDGFQFGETPVRYMDGKILVGDREFTFYNPGFMRGWVIGDFENSVIRTKDYELGMIMHEKNEHWGFHYHSKCDEINLLCSGSMTLNGREIHTGQVFKIPRNQIGCAKFLQTCKIACVKIPSVPGDKFVV